MASWSYALRRIRILFAAIEAISSFVYFLVRTRLYRADGAPPLARGAPPQVLCPNSPLGSSASRPGPTGFHAGRVSLRPHTGPASRPAPWSLLENLGDDPRAYGTATLSNGEPKALVHGDRVDELDRHLDIVSRHDHLRPLREVRDPRHVGGPEIELRAIPGEERRVASALLLLEAIDLGL